MPSFSHLSASQRMSRKDFFISYNQADQDWAEWIAWILEEEGYSVIIQAWDFTAGGNFVVEMDKATSNADKTIAVLSQNYLDAKYTDSEWAAAFKQDPKGEKRKLIPFPGLGSRGSVCISTHL